MKYKISLFLCCLAFSVFSQKFETGSWMGDLNAQIHDKTLGSLVLPGAYRCGLQRIEQSTGNPDRCNATSQSETVRGLLDLGTRYLDLSVVYWKNEWYLGSFSYSYRDGLQIAVGQPLDKAMDEIAGFLSGKSHSKEIVIVHISRYVDSKLTTEKKEKLEAKKEVFAETSFGLLDSLKKQELLKICSTKLSLFLCQRSDAFTMRVDSILNHVQKADKPLTGAAILLINSSTDVYPSKAIRANQCGTKDAVGLNTSFIKTDSAVDLSKQWNEWGSDMAGCYQVRRWVLTWKNNESKCTQRFAELANERLEELLQNGFARPASGVFCIAFINRSTVEKIISLNI